MPLTLTAVAEPDLLYLPWQLPLERWPDDVVVALPRGISRHIVRFVRINGVVYAIKETERRIAEREYDLLVDLAKRDVPCVDPIGVVHGRVTPEDEDLPAALITRHLQFSLPYRALYSTTLRPDTATRLLDALTVLVVRLHLAGFAWNDCSLSNTLFRRDAGAFAAYLVDAETGELHDHLSDGQRMNDLDVASVNVAGELLDLEAGGYLHPSVDPIEIGKDFRLRYDALWSALLEPVTMQPGERYRLEERMRTLNSLGFDVAEMRAEQNFGEVTVTPKVVDAGHHARRLLRLTGLDVEEYQARRLLNDLDSYRLELGLTPADEEIAAYRWVSEVFEPLIGSIPGDLRHKLEPAQVFHEVLEHRWFLSERAGHDVGLKATMNDYVMTVLAKKPDEESLLGGVDDDTSSMQPVSPSDTDPLQDTMVLSILRDLGKK
jgi:hypothetical protein